jgi:hypothetical protein
MLIFGIAPPWCQSAIYLPDDPDKILVGKEGQVLLDFGCGGFRSFGFCLQPDIVGSTTWVRQQTISPRTWNRWRRHSLSHQRPASHGRRPGLRNGSSFLWQIDWKSRVAQEYQRRLNHQQMHQTGETHQLAEMIQKVKRGLTRLIDAYEDGLLSKSEFEPRVRVAKQRLTKLDAEAEAMKEQELQEQELRLVIGQFEEFAKRVLEGLQEPDWLTRREIIRALVKRIEIDWQHVRVIYKVGPSPFVLGPDRGSLQRLLEA